jgi:hypothetical protein
METGLSNSSGSRLAAPCMRLLLLMLPASQKKTIRPPTCCWGLRCREPSNVQADSSNRNWQQ